MTGFLVLPAYRARWGDSWSIGPFQPSSYLPRLIM